VAGAGEPRHVGTGLSDHRVDDEPIEARDRLQQTPRGRIGLHPGGDPLGQRPGAGIEEVDMAQDPLGGDGVVSTEMPVQRFDQLGDHRTQLPLGQLRQRHRVTLPSDQRLDHQSAGLGEHLRRNRSDLDPRVLEQLLQERVHFSRDLQRRLRPLQLGLEPLVASAEALELDLRGRPARLGLRRQALPGAGVAGLAPLRDVGGVQPLAAQQRASFLRAVPQRVVLVEDRFLVLGSERSPPRSSGRVGLVHHAIIGARAEM
jgi:hypothetical protein